MTHHTPPPSRAAGYCGSCHRVVRLGERCCDYDVGWITPEGLAFESYAEYAEAVGGGRMIDARRHGEKVPDWVLELPSELFLGALLEVETTELIQRAYEEDWPAGRLGPALRRLAARYRS